MASKVWFSPEQRKLCLQAVRELITPEDRQEPKFAHFELSRTLEDAVMGGDDTPEGKDFALNFTSLWCSKGNRRQKELIRKEIYQIVQQALGWDGSEKEESPHCCLCPSQELFLQCDGKSYCSECAELLTQSVL